MNKLAVITAISVAIFSSSTMANSKTITYVPANDSKETAICVVSANEGRSAAKVEAKRLGVRYSSFSREIKCVNIVAGTSTSDNTETAQVTVTARNIQFIAQNENPETRACLTAVVKGMDDAKAEYGKSIKSLSCNGTNISSFVKKFENDTVRS